MIGGLTTTLGTRGFFSCVMGSFVLSAEGWTDTSGEAARKNLEAFRAFHFLRLDQNRKLRMKSLWHPERLYEQVGYLTFSGSSTSM